MAMPIFCNVFAIHALVPKMESVDAEPVPRKSYVGNGMNIALEENNTDLSVIGNDNRIEIGRNNGALIVTGNNDWATIHSGKGSIKVTGNDILVEIGPGVDDENISWTGNNISIVRISARMESFGHVDTKNAPAANAPASDNIELDPTSSNDIKQETHGQHEDSSFILD